MQLETRERGWNFLIKTGIKTVGGRVKLCYKLDGLDNGFNMALVSGDTGIQIINNIMGGAGFSQTLLWEKVCAENASW